MCWFWIALYSFLSFRVPVVRRGEGCHHYIPPVDVDDIRHSLQDVEVEVGVTGDGAVQARLEKWSPLLLQDAGWAAAVVLTNPGHPGKHHLTNTYTHTQLKDYIWVAQAFKSTVSVSCTELFRSLSTDYSCTAITNTNMDNLKQKADKNGRSRTRNTVFLFHTINFLGNNITKNATWPRAVCCIVETEECCADRC